MADVVADLLDEGDQVRLVVGDPARQQSPPLLVDQHDMVMSLPGVDPNPAMLNSVHPVLLLLGPLGSPIDKLAVRSLGSDEVADLNQRSSRQEASGGQSNEAIRSAEN
jgi:hypothetical protein